MTRLLYIDPCRRAFTDVNVASLPALLGPGDLVVVNDAATIPASLRVRDRDLEVRLAAEHPQGEGRFAAVLFGAGDWHTPTEHRPPPPPLPVGTRLVFGDDLGAEIGAVSDLSPRLVALAFDAPRERLFERLFRHGRPVQYSHATAPLELWDIQTAYAARPWAVEPPSAGLVLRNETLLALRRNGVALASITHAAGLSSTGDPALDAALPFPERYDIPEATALAIARAERVIAVGTTVVRALEGAALANGGRLVAGRGVTDLRIGPTFVRRVVDGLVTGLHEPGSSHLRLLAAFVEPPLLDAAYAHAAATGYRGHELGDASLVLCGRTA